MSETRAPVTPATKTLAKKAAPATNTPTELLTATTAIDAGS